MRDKDSQLIFESYQNDILISEEWTDIRTWPWKEIGKVLDPTGISSWGDFTEAVKEFSDKPWEIGNIGKLILTAFCCIPNLGLLEAGVGGIGWGALKSAAIKAMEKGSTSLVPITNSVLKAISSNKIALKAFDKVTGKMFEKGMLTAEAKDALSWAIKHGGIDNMQHGKDVAEYMSKAGGLKGFTSAATGLDKGLGQAALGFGGIYKGAAREFENITDKDEKSSDSKKQETKNATATGQRPSSKMRTAEELQASEKSKTTTKYPPANEIKTGESRFARNRLGK